MRAEAIAEYHRMLAADESLTAELFSRLKEMMRVNRLAYGERELGVSLRPHLLMREQYDRLVHASQVVCGAFDKVEAALVENPSMMETVGLREAERRMALIDPGFPLSTITTRLDAFVDDERITFVEYNAENPSSLTDQPGLNQILFEVRALESLAERYRLRQFTPVETLLQTMLATFSEWGGRGVPNIAIVDWADLPTANEFLLLRNYFAGRGVPTIICTPEELEYDNRKLRCRDFAIDLVYKRVIIHEFLAHADERHPLVRAYVNHDVCLINPFRCKIVHKKAAFELLTDEAHDDWFSPSEREVIHSCVPWTRRLIERKTGYHGQAIDLVEHVRKNRAAFIVKPNDDYGGHGIFLGKQTSEAEWESVISTALASGDYVVQEAIELYTEEFPIFNDEQWSLQPMYVDTNPFMFRGKADGVMVRLSDSPIVNVTSGGGETGFFVIDGLALK
jgi:glutathionylspermidine synthase